MSFNHSIIKNKNAPLTIKVRERYNLKLCPFFKEPKNDSTNSDLKSQGPLFISLGLYLRLLRLLHRHLRQFRILHLR